MQRTFDALGRLTEVTGSGAEASRWYDPSTGGFSSRDTWTLNPVPSINANRYGYGNGDPLTNTDPSGHFSLKDLERTVERTVRHVNLMYSAELVS
ncbi:RHS repeat-associated core domain-containing protein [Streptomyces caeni]|uniref:RHS repeat-associated core domain-containing protein n=1 Tax=Streptomyces caeni TaxID=2307231 RepID=A0ABW4IWS5_9ACTN